MYVYDKTAFRSIAENITIHKKFNEDTFENDIALIKIKDMIPENSTYIAPIKLSTGETPINTLCKYSGFGFTEVNIIVTD